jgi:Recombinase zinc beta ribbon domain
MTVTTTQGPRGVVRRDIESPYLLSGFARCAECGWSMTVITRRRHGKTRTAFLGCLSHHKRGPHICPNGRLVPLETANHAVLGALNAEALDPRIVSAVIEMVFAQLAPAHAESSLDALRRDLRDVDRKIAHLTAAVERGAALDPLIAQLHARQQERERLLTAIASARTLGRLHVDRAAIEATVQAQCARWRALLTESLEDGRTLLREVLSGPLVFTPEGKGYHFRARVATGELIAGAVNDGAGAGAHKVASPSIPSWNQIAGFLRSMRQLRDSTGFAA